VGDFVRWDKVEECDGGCWYKNSMIEVLCDEHFDQWRIMHAIEMDKNRKISDAFSPTSPRTINWARRLIEKNWR
jgi:hypothetical protein